MMASIKNRIHLMAIGLFGRKVVVIEPTTDQAAEMLKTAQVVLNEARAAIDTASKKAKVIGCDEEATQLANYSNEIADVVATTFVVAPMRTACKFGWHKWTKWTPRGTVARKVEDLYSLSDTNVAFSTLLTTECLGCGAVRHHEQKGIEFKS